MEAEGPLPSVEASTEADDDPMDGGAHQVETCPAPLSTISAVPARLM